MVELGVYGTARVYWTVFAGPGGIPPEAVTRTLLTFGVLSAAVGAVMCWYQRHIKRLLAFSTVAHTGLFLIGLGLLTPEATSGITLYVIGHAGVKAALFACAGILLDRYGSIDEYALHGRARELRLTAGYFTAAALALAGLPPFGTGLGKAVTEETAGPWFTALFVLVSAVTGGAVLRIAARVFGGLGTPPADGAERETSGEREQPETEQQLTRVPATMLAVPGVLLAGALLAGVTPALHAAVALAADEAAPGVTVAVMPPHWSAAGLLLGLLSAAVATGLAVLAVRHPQHTRSRHWLNPLRLLHSGHIGDYVAWTMAGTALLAALTLTGLL